MSAERWTKRKRRDGLAVVEGIDGLLVMPADERLPIDKCPCCGQQFVTVKAAQATADMVYPIAEAANAEKD